LISTHDKLREVDVFADALTTEVIDDVEELFMIFGLKRYLRSGGDV
jgi:hypothetical protein